MLNELMYKTKLKKQKFTHILEVLNSRHYKATNSCACGKSLGLDKVIALTLLTEDPNLMYQCKDCLCNAGHATLEDDMILSCCTPNEFAEILVTSMQTVEIQSADISEGGDEGSGGANSSGPGGNDSLEETVRFLDCHDQNIGGFATMSDKVDLGDQMVSDLGNFLSRPVQIYSFTWNESDTVPNYTHTVTPWQAFFNTSYIKNKLDNYSFLRCNMKIKVMVNASPFYYGAMLVAWCPLASTYPANIVSDSNASELIPYSQRPHVWIYPQKNEGAEMTLPFFYHKNWISAVSSADLTNMGTLSFIPYTLLQSANGASGTGVTVTVYAWAENVELSGPTITNAVQAKDEYKISGIASAVASAAGQLKKIPIIGPYATATQFGADLVSNVAAFFGYCNPPILNDIMPYRQMPFPQLASTEISYPVEKMTIDPKNELTIDPSPFGLKPIDELNISYLIQKESYLCTTNWLSSQAIDTVLFSAATHPCNFNNTNGTSELIVQQTPACWVAQLFNYWRGSLIYRFRFIASPFHKGRVRLTFDPTGNSTTNIINTSANTGAVFTEVIDLSVDTNVEFTVPYNQAYAFSRMLNPTQANITWSTSSSPTYLYTTGIHSGTITLRVVTALTGPTSTATIPILVSVRGGPDLEYSDPKDIAGALTQFQVQSKDVYSNAESQKLQVTDGLSYDDDNKYLVYMGEKIVTLRQLLRRYSFVRTFASYGTNTTNTVVNFCQARMPLMYGFDSNGPDQATSVASTGTKSFTWNQISPIPYIVPAFVGVRGALNVAINCDTSSGAVLPSVRVLRRNNTVGSSSRNVVTGTTGSQISSFNVLNRSCGSAAQALINQNTQSGITASLPMYSWSKFQFTNPLYYSNPVGDDGALYDMWQFEAYLPSGGNFYADAYYSIGTDFNVLFFLNVPTMFTYTIPTPV
jgi:hypothetical protein